MSTLIPLLLRFRWLTALLAGVMAAFGYQPWGLWPLTLLGTGLLLWLTAKSLRKRQAFFIGWVFGAGHFCWGLQWIAVAFTFQGTMPAWLGYVSVFALSLYLAVAPALAMLGAFWTLRLNARAGPASVYGYVLAAAGFWTITEWLRSWVFTGFAWNPLSVSMLETPVASSATAIGTYGASGVVVIISAVCIGLLAAIVEGRGKLIIERLFNLVAVAAASWLLGWAASGAELRADFTANTVTIAQPNISQEERNDSTLEDANIAKLVRQSGREDSDSAPRLLLWPESAIPWYLESGYPFRYYQFQPGENAQATRRAVAGLLGPQDILLTGNDRLIFDNGQIVAAYNSVTAMTADADIIGWYNKAHLVPYGEYLALRWLLEPLGAARLVPGTLDFWPGPGPQTVKLGAGLPNAGIQICYEIIFSGQVVDAANRPDFIFNPSNDAWFGDVGPPQHLAQARLRAIEEGLPVLRSTPTGISAVIGADGRILKSLPLGVAGRIDTDIPAATTPTWFARMGNTLPVGVALLLIAIAIIPVARKRRRS